jgi:hypothetical protein
MRRKPTNCQNEPPYEGEETVVFCIRWPDATLHEATKKCAIEHPHLISECGMWAPDEAPALQEKETRE